MAYRGKYDTFWLHAWYDHYIIVGVCDVRICVNNIIDETRRQQFFAIHTYIAYKRTVWKLLDLAQIGHFFNNK